LPDGDRADVIPCTECGGTDIVYADTLWSESLCRRCYTDAPKTEHGNPMAKPKPIADPKTPITVELFPSYEAARVSHVQLVPWVEGILAVTQIRGAEQEAWAAECGREIKRKLKSETAALKAELAPVKAIEETIRGYRKPGIQLLEKLDEHLAGLMNESRTAAAQTQAALMPHVTSEEERAVALAAVTPKPPGWVERADWSWEVVDLAAVPLDYFVLDEKRLDREVRELKGSFAVPGFRAKNEPKGHFRT
jgi:hypothetical protein